MPASVFGSRPEPEPNTIAFWSGTLSNIPAGWVLCDGNNGTPNFLGRFPISIPDSGTDPGTTGGSDSVTLSTSQLPSHSHGGGSSTDGDHNHTIEIDLDGNPGGDAGDMNGVSSYTVGSVGDHSHSVSVDSTGGGSSIENRPAFEEVAIIMKT